MSGQWAGSDRRERLPANWAELREAVMRRAGGRCEAIKSSGQRCPNGGRDCDHIQAGDDHSLSNLQWLCIWHHRAKSSAEGNDAQAVVRAKLRRPGRRHPGLR